MNEPDFITGMMLLIGYLGLVCGALGLGGLVLKFFLGRDV
jgi:hypothetical protein